METKYGILSKDQLIFHAVGWTSWEKYLLLDRNKLAMYDGKSRKSFKYID